MSQYRMLSDPFLARFKAFMAAESRNPQGAFDTALKVQLKKEKRAPYRFVPIEGAGGLFLRERSNDLALDEATEISDPAKKILSFLKGKLGDDDMAQVEEMLKMEAGVPVDSQVQAERMVAGAKERGATAQDAKRRQLAQDAHLNASTERMADFAKRFPGASRIGIV